MPGIFTSVSPRSALGASLLCLAIFILWKVLVTSPPFSNVDNADQDKQGIWKPVLRPAPPENLVMGKESSEPIAGNAAAEKIPQQPLKPQPDPPAPQKSASSSAFKAIDLNGTIWRRFGRPFHYQSLSTLAIAFKAPPSTKKSLLLYGQVLNGVFHPAQRQYLAVCLDNDAITIFWSFSNGQRKTFQLKGSYNTDKWHALTVFVNGAEVTGKIQADIRNPSVLNSNPEGGDNTKGFPLDSGLYIGAVVDRLSVTAHPEINGQLELFNGQVHSPIVVNGAAIDLDDTARVDWGITDDTIGKYMSDVLKYDIKQPLPKLEAVDLHPTDPTMLKFPVVGAISDNHVTEMLDMPSSIAANMPERGILIYNLGLNAASHNTLNSLCNVTVRGFRKDVHPELVAALVGMRWKPFILHSVMQEFGGVLYADASIRFKQSINSLSLFSKSTGFIGFSPEGVNPVSAFTHDVTMNSLDVARADTAKQMLTIGGIQVWVDRYELRNTLMRQWLGCALSSTCMHPPGAVVYGCQFGIRWTGKFIGCHRFDQAAISVILWKMFHDNKGLAYHVADPLDLKYASIERGPTNHFPRCKRPPSG